LPRRLQPQDCERAAGELREDATSLPAEEDIPRIKFSDDSAEAPAAY
jgi:hypothetical protein